MFEFKTEKCFAITSVFENLLTAIGNYANAGIFQQSAKKSRMAFECENLFSSIEVQVMVAYQAGRNEMAIEMAKAYSERNAKPAPSSLAQQVEQARAEFNSWPEEVRSRVRLEGRDQP